MSNQDSHTAAYTQRLPELLRQLLTHPALRATDSVMLPGALKSAADEIERLRERCKDYQQQVNDCLAHIGKITLSQSKGADVGSEASGLT